VNVDTEYNILMSTAQDINKRSVLVHLQSKTTKFTAVHAGTTSRQHSHWRALFKARTVKSQILPCGITVAIAPHSRGNPVRCYPHPHHITVNVVPITAVSRCYRSIPAIPITVQSSTLCASFLRQFTLSLNARSLY